MFEESLSPQKTIEMTDPELTGRLIDVVEDWMEENGFEGIAVQGEDYDFLSSRFRTALGLDLKEIKTEMPEPKKSNSESAVPVLMEKKQFSLESPIKWGKDSTGSAMVKYGDIIFSVNFYGKDLEHAIYYDRHLFAKEPHRIHEEFCKWFAGEVTKAK